MADISARARPARGTKRTCEACSRPFYDLTRSPIVCPYCSEPYTVPPPVVMSAKIKSTPRPSAKVFGPTSKPKVAEDVEDIETDIKDDADTDTSDDADALILDEDPDDEAVVPAADDDDIA